MKNKWKIQIFKNTSTKAQVIGKGPDVTKCFSNKKELKDWILLHIHGYAYLDWQSYDRVVNAYIGTSELQ